MSELVLANGSPYDPANFSDKMFPVFYGKQCTTCKTEEFTFASTEFRSQILHYLWSVDDFFVFCNIPEQIYVVLPSEKVKSEVDKTSNVFIDHQIEKYPEIAFWVVPTVSAELDVKCCEIKTRTDMKKVQPPVKILL